MRARPVRHSACRWSAALARFAGEAAHPGLRVLPAILATSKTGSSGIRITQRKAEVGGTPEPYHLDRSAYGRNGTERAYLPLRNPLWSRPVIAAEPSQLTSGGSIMAVCASCGYSNTPDGKSSCYQCGRPLAPADAARLPRQTRLRQGISPRRLPLRLRWRRPGARRRLRLRPPSRRPGPSPRRLRQVRRRSPARVAGTPRHQPASDPASTAASRSMRPRSRRSVAWSHPRRLRLLLRLRLRGADLGPADGSGRGPRRADLDPARGGSGRSGAGRLPELRVRQDTSRQAILLQLRQAARCGRGRAGGRAGSG